MPDGSAGRVIAAAGPPPREPRLVSPLLRRILLVNALPLLLLVAALLYLDQYQTGLLEAEIGGLNTQAAIYAGAIGETALRTEGTNVSLADDRARPLLRSLTEPTPAVQARLYDTTGRIVADSRVREGGSGAILTEPLPPPAARGAVSGALSQWYDAVLRLLPRGGGPIVEDATSPSAGLDWQPDLREELRMALDGQARPIAPYVRRTTDNRLLVSVAVPVTRANRTVGMVLVTREAREVDQRLFEVRISILALFAATLALTVAMSWYLSWTLARPMLRLAAATDRLREGKGRQGEVPDDLLARGDEIGELANALDGSARALWTRMDAIESFAADVAHEIKNPLSSIQSAIETLRRIEDPARQRALLNIIHDDVRRLDRLISDISDASRLDAEMSRVATERVDLAPIIAVLADIHESTRAEDDPRLVIQAPAEGLVVDGVEGRLVQVLRNLISNAVSFSPGDGAILLRAQETGGVIEVAVEDDGPGIPDGKLEQVFERFYSERPQSERFGRHSGLGLSISRQIVQALRGRISAENRRDPAGRVLGARFVVRLPKAATA